MNTVSLDRCISVWRFRCLYFHKGLQADLWSLRAVCKKDIFRRFDQKRMIVYRLKCIHLHLVKMHFVVSSWCHGHKFMVCAVHNLCIVVGRADHDFTLCLHCLSSIKLNFSALKLNTLKYCRPAVKCGHFLVVLWVICSQQTCRVIWSETLLTNKIITLPSIVCRTGLHWCKFDILVCLSSVQTDATSLANNSQNCWMSNKLLPSFAYPVACCWELLCKVF